jgi:hypothetical protein
MDSSDSPEISSKKRPLPDFSRFHYEHPWRQAVLFFFAFFTTWSVTSLLLPHERASSVPEFVLSAAFVATFWSAFMIIVTRRQYRKKLESGKVAP